MGENAIFAGMSQFDVEHEYLGIDITADPPRLLAPFCAIINILWLLSSVDGALLNHARVPTDSCKAIHLVHLRV